MKKYEIKNTIHGPAVLYEGEILFLDQTLSFFDIIDENAEFLFDITDALISNIKEEVGYLLSALEDRHPANVGPAYAVIGVISHYWRLIHNEYPEYSQAMLKARGEENTWDMNDPNKALIHKFYTKGNIDDN